MDTSLQSNSWSVLSLAQIDNNYSIFFVWKTHKGNYKTVLVSTYFISKQWLTLPAQWGFLWGHKRVLPLPFSIAVLAGGAERGGGACRGGVSCCRGGSSPLGELGGCSERWWEGTRWRPADWWSCTQMWTSIQKPCPGPDPEGMKHKKMFIGHVRSTGSAFSELVSFRQEGNRTM